MLKCVECTIWGKDLDYDYLFWIKKNAIRFGIKGIVFFKKDGSIKVISEGAERGLLFFIKKLRKGRPFKHFFHPIEHFSVVWHKAKDEYQDFAVVN